MAEHILALDQGTTSSRAIVFDRQSKIVAVAAREFEQVYPRPGWVEHKPAEIWDSQREAALAAVEQSGLSWQDITAVGITNQRETTILWDRNTGEPVANAIVWQCRRTADICRDLRQQGLEKDITAKTGLVVDAYFSGTKVKWLLDTVPGLRQRANRGEIAFGTVDSWLLWQLTGGAVHATDYTNASRTMLYNIHKLEWDEEILNWLDIPREILPRVQPSSGVFGNVVAGVLGDRELPIAGVAGDQQAALFGQACFRPGEAKNTYGTGCFMLMNTGEQAMSSENGLLTTIAWGLEPGKVEYALEGSVFIAGAVIQWLRDQLGLLETAAQSEELARQVEDNGGVYLVPAFVGLGAPYWDMEARGTITGLTRGSTRQHVARAALESIAYQSRDVLAAMEADSGLKLSLLKVDGGAAANDFLMQFQSDILKCPVARPDVIETTALGAAYLAGLAAGLWPDKNHIRQKWLLQRRFEPEMPQSTARELYRGWQQAVARTRKRT